MNNKINPIRETSDEARNQARQLIRSARSGSIAFIEPKTSYPSVSRTLTANDIDGAPIILVSQLSTHTAAMLKDNRVSLLLGEIGKGDPLAHPRITLHCKSEQIERNTPKHQELRQRFILRHPKAELYVDFGDFNFFRLNPISASLNGGFGKAYELSPKDFLIASPIQQELAKIEMDVVEHMNEDHKSAIDHYAHHYAKNHNNGWKLVTIDSAGLNLLKADQLLRIEFEQEIQDLDQLRPILTKMAKTGKDKKGTPD